MGEEKKLMLNLTKMDICFSIEPKPLQSNLVKIVQLI